MKPKGKGCIRIVIFRGWFRELKQEARKGVRRGAEGIYDLHYAKRKSAVLWGHYRVSGKSMVQWGPFMIYDLGEWRRGKAVSGP